MNSIREFGIKKFEYWYFFMIIIYGGMATMMFTSMMYYTNNFFMFLLPLVMTAILIHRNRTKFTPKFIYASLLLLIWCIIQCKRWQQNIVTLSFFLLYNLFVAYVLVSVYKEKIPYLYEHFLVNLSIIGLVLWGLVVILPGVFDPLLSSLNIGGSTDESIAKSNLIIFSLTSDGNNAFSSFIRRNAGFAWEPGRYAVMLLPAIYFNLLINNFLLNKRLFILLLALLSTNSTTGLLTVGVLMLFYILNSKKNYFLAFMPVVMLAFLIMNYFGIQDKIDQTKHEGDEFIWEKVGEARYYQNKGETYTYSLQRFDAFTVYAISFVADPILGYGPDEMNAYYKREIGDFLRAPNGNMQTIAKYGLILSVFIFIFSYRSSKRFVTQFNAKGEWCFFVLFWLMSMSYALYNVPIYLAMNMYDYFLGRKV